MTALGLPTVASSLHNSIPIPSSEKQNKQRNTIEGQIHPNIFLELERARMMKMNALIVAQKRSLLNLGWGSLRHAVRCYFHASSNNRLLYVCQETEDITKRGRLSKKKKTRMPPSGTKRVRATPGSNTVPRVSTRSGKKYSTNFQQDNAEEQLHRQLENNGVDTMVQGEEEHRPASPVPDWSVFYEQSNADAHVVSKQLEAVPKGKLQIMHSHIV